MQRHLAGVERPLPSDNIKIASWNINSIKVRGSQVIDWLKESETDILFMQETKSTDENFPENIFTGAGYAVHYHGQKAYNGVAVASRIPLDDVRCGLPLIDDSPAEDEQARYIEIDLFGMTIAGLYLPNGNPTTADDGTMHPKLAYKLDWMARLHHRAKTLNDQGRPIILMGDFNIIPDAEDCWDIDHWQGDALHHPLTLAAWRRLNWLGYSDAWRGLHQNRIAYSFWDYQGGAWQKDNGIRIDHILTNAEAGDRLLSVDIDKTPRGNQQASDHTPIWCCISP